MNETLVFSLILLVSVLSGMTVPSAIYKLVKYRYSLQNSKEFIAVFLGVAAGCACSIGLSLIAFTGSIGGSVIGFLSLWQEEILALSVGLLAYSLLVELNQVGNLRCKKE
jgi:O-antigen/teichoic acid export membrane protein